MSHPRNARGQVMLGDGTLATGTVVRTAHGGEYVTLVLDDSQGRRRTIDNGGRQVYLRADRVRWIDAG